MYAILGTVQFEGLKSFSEFIEIRKANYAEHALIAGRPKLQRVGTNLAEISIGIRLHSGFCDPEAEIAALNGYVESGEVLPLVLGNGRVLGNFVLVDTNTKYTKALPNGDIITAEIQLNLKENYDEDLLDKLRREATRTAIGIDGNNVRRVAASRQAVTATRAAAGQLRRANTSVSTARKAINVARSGAARAASGIQTAKRSVTKAREALESARSSVQQNLSRIRQAQQIIDQTTTSLTRLASVGVALDAGNLAEATSAMTTLEASMSQLNRVSVPYAAQVATRGL